MQHSNTEQQRAGDLAIGRLEEAIGNAHDRTETVEWQLRMLEDHLSGACNVVCGVFFFLFFEEFPFSFLFTC